MNTNFKQSSAYELADALAVESSQMEYGYVVSDWELLYNSSKMLRQQADEIVVLKRILADEGITVGYDYLNDCVAMLRRAKQ